MLLIIYQYKSCICMIGCMYYSTIRSALRECAWRNEHDKISFRRENERKLMQYGNCIIKQIEITSFRGRRVYHIICTSSFALTSYLSVSAFCRWPLRALSTKSTKSFITRGIVPDINRRDSMCRQFFFCIKYFRVT